MHDPEKHEPGAGKMGKEKCLSLDKALGVALLGALGSLAFYYIFIHLSEENQQSFKNHIVSAVKSAMAKFSQE